MQSLRSIARGQVPLDTILQYAAFLLDKEDPIEIDPFYFCQKVDEWQTNPLLETIPSLIRQQLDCWKERVDYKEALDRLVFNHYKYVTQDVILGVNPTYLPDTIETWVEAIECDMCFIVK
jgi:hypothetical protein